MPGSSLWLMPPAHSPVATLLSSLIAHTIPSHFAQLSPPQFSPHVTLTSEIDPQLYGDQPQQWLDQQISCPPGKDLSILFETLDTEQPFFRKLTIRVSKHPVLAELAENCRRIGVAKDNGIAQRWVEHDYRPHCSLMYADTTISEQKMTEIKTILQDAQIVFKDLEQSNVNALSGWTGGTVWLVPTDREISAWQPIASKEL